MKSRNKGDRYRPIVTINKMKNDVPTRVTISGNEYVLLHKDQYKGPSKKSQSGGNKNGK